MLRRPTNYQKSKFELARKKFPPGVHWTETQLLIAIGISEMTACRWLLRWYAEGWVRRMETGENLWDAGTTKYRYSFREKPFRPLSFKEAQKSSARPQAETYRDIPVELIPVHEGFHVSVTTAADSEEEALAKAADAIRRRMEETKKIGSKHPGLRHVAPGGIV